MPVYLSRTTARARPLLSQSSTLLSPASHLSCRRPFTCSHSASSQPQPRRHHPKDFTPPTHADLAELRSAVQEFCRREITPEVAASTDANNLFPSDMWAKLGDAGFLGITADTDFGGLGMGYQAHCIVMEELSRASGSIALSYAAHSQLCVNQLMLNGSDEQKREFLPALIKGEKVGALAMSEHTAGSDVVSMRLKAKKVDGGYVLNGTKMWITNGPDAHTLVVYAKTEPEAGSKGITAFIVTSDSPGFEPSPKLDKLGMRGSNTAELVFDNVFVPESRILGQLNKGVRVLMSGLDLERLVLSAGPIGLMAAALDVALPYTHERKQFGTPIATNQLVQGKLADMYTRYRSAQALTMAVAAQVDNAADPDSSSSDKTDEQASPDAATSPISSRDCAAAILYAAEAATQSALDCIQLLGGMGYMNETPAGRILRDAKLYEIGAGTSEVRRMVIGRAFNREYLG